MGLSFWIRRWFTVLLGTFAVIGLAQAVKGHTWIYALREAVIWAPITATVFAVGRFLQARRGQHCALCQDTPEMQQAGGGDA